MKDKFEDDLADRLQKADPAKRKKAPKLSEDTIHRAISKETKPSVGDRIFGFASAGRKWLVGGTATAGAAAVAIAVAVAMTPTPLIQMGATQDMGRNESAASSDAALKQMMPYQVFEYSAGAGLSSERGRGTVYKLVRDGDPEEILTRVAQIFGVSGSIKKVPEFSKDNPGYFYSASNDPWGYDAVNPTISLWWSSTGYWNYSNPAAYPQPVCVSDDSDSKDGACEGGREVKPTPELLPSREEAVAKALEIFNATGLAATEADLRVYMDEWGVSVASALKVDGQETQIEWYMGWSSTGEISYAGGHSVKVENMGQFDTISEVSAVGRLSDWRWFGSPSASFYEKYAPDYSEGVLRDNSSTSTDSSAGTVDESVSAEEGSGSSGGSSGEVDPSQPIEPVPSETIEPEVVKLEIVKAESALLTIWDANGDAWLVPGFVMVNDQGWFSSVISLIDGVIELPKPMEYDIMPLPADDTPVKDN